MARKLGVAQTGTKKDLMERIRPAWQVKYTDLTQICDPATGLPEVKEPSKVHEPTKFRGGGSREWGESIAGCNEATGRDEEGERG